MLKPPSVNAKLFALFLNGMQLGFRNVLFAWGNDLCRKDDAKRAIVLGAMNAFSKHLILLTTGNTPLTRSSNRFLHLLDLVVLQHGSVA
jgi:hypothetical protein